MNKIDVTTGEGSGGSAEWRVTLATLAKKNDVRGIAAFLDSTTLDTEAVFWALYMLRYARAAEATPVMARFAGDARDMIRAWAAAGLADAGDSRGVLHLQSLLEDELPAIRVHACRGLGRLGGREAVDLLAMRLGDGEWRVRRAAASALRRLGDRRGLRPLRQAIAKEGTWRKVVLAGAYVRLGLSAVWGRVVKR